jgi:Beta-lactamase superfamily domain
MQIRWYGQSAFLISAERTVFVDPFAPMEGLAEREMQFDYPAIEGVEADLLLVTHEHADHNAAHVVGGSPQILRSTAGTFDSPLGEVIAVASEHDEAAGTKRAARTRSSASRSTGCASVTSATSASPNCATNNYGRSARSTFCSFPSAAARRSGASRPPRSCAR